jgi:hypothetical protein
METKTYINSGILEQYIAGNLSDNENVEVFDMMQKHPEVLQEVLEIEHAIITLTRGLCKSKPLSFSAVTDKLNTSKVVNLNDSNPNTKLFTYLGWAASIVLAGGLIWCINLNTNLEDTLTTVSSENTNLEIELNTQKINLEERNVRLAETNSILTALTNKNTVKVPLGGQAVSPESYANAYWDATNNKVYLDLNGLPEPPEGKVYQVWSLTLNPLTPTSLGTVEGFNSNNTKIFTFSNPNQSQAFGVTLEPEGGSISPTLEQLYTLGVVDNS